MLTHSFLSEFQPFAGLNEQLLTKIAQNVKVARAAKGNIIFKRGRILSDLYFLIEGEVDLINNEFGIEKVKKKSPRRSLALNQFSPTMASAIAKTPVKFFSINSAWLEAEIAAQNSQLQGVISGQDEDCSEMKVSDVTDSDDWMSCILQSPVFNRIPMSQLQELFARFEKVPVQAGERIVKEGAKGDFFYVIAYGSARVTSRAGNIDVVLNAGDYFGEEALISQAPRNASIEMLNDGILKRLSAEDFIELVKAPVLQFVQPSELADIKPPYKVLDVRLPIEFRTEHMPGSINVPLSRLRSSLQELGQGTKYLVSGEAGSRAEIAAYILCQAGFDAAILSMPVERAVTLQSAS